VLATDVKVKANPEMIPEWNRELSSSKLNRVRSWLRAPITWFRCALGGATKEQAVEPRSTRFPLQFPIR